MHISTYPQSSGSDIVIEEDLAEIFGRSRIDRQLASSFRAAVAKSASTKLCEGITLDAGPGPTVLRGLSKYQDPYFSMVVQCSLLTSVLQKPSLAAAIKQFFEKKAEDAPPEHVLRATPSEEGILGFLRACEEQTSSYNWRFILIAVARTLGVPEKEAFQPLPAVVFRGLISMLPLVQHFPEDRLIHAELGSTDGACLLVVWAHHVLSLTVRVFTYWNNRRTETEFGAGVAQLIIDVRSVVDWVIREPSVTLLESSPKQGNEELFRLEPDPDESKIEAIYTVPAKGYGMAIFEDIAMDISPGREAVVEEMMLLTCGFALIISGHLRMTHHQNQDSNVLSGDDGWSTPDGSQPASELEEPDCPFVSDIPYLIKEARILRAAEMLFGMTKLNKKTIYQYMKLCEGKGFDANEGPSYRINAIFDHPTSEQNAWDKESVWPLLLKAAKYLSILILAFAHTQDLQYSSQLQLSFQYAALCKHPLAQILSKWSGTEPIPVTELAWYQAIAMLMVSHDLRIDGSNDSSPCLLSDRGWSIFLSSFLQPTENQATQIRDPSYVSSGFFIVQKGVPCRNGVRKHAIFDGPDKGRLADFEWQRVDSGGDVASLRCADKVAYGRPLYGERRDSFVVTLRFDSESHSRTYTRRAGYYELFTALWTVCKTKPCEHAYGTKDALTLPPGCSTVCSFGDQDGLVDDSTDLEFMDHERVVICLTAHSSAARWRALIAIAHSRVSGDLDSSRRVLLRSSDCCFKCTVDQTSTSTEKWFVVL